MFSQLCNQAMVCLVPPTSLAVALFVIELLFCGLVCAIIIIFLVALAFVFVGGVILLVLFF